MSVQTTVADKPVKAYEGLIADGAPRYLVSAAAEAAVKPGQPVLRGTNPDRQVLPVTDGDTVDATTLAGVLVLDVAMSSDKIDSNGDYVAESQVNAMRFGVIYVLATSAVTAGNPVYVGNATAQLGDYADAAGTGLVQLPGARWLSSAGAGQLGKISVQLMD